jgi:TetR/AcrR family transcriptional regulator, regulator of biofilm formation and stress response
VRVDADGAAAAEPDGRRRRGLRRRAALIEATLAVVARDGAAAVTHASVAAAAGLACSAVSHHFASIDDLLAAALSSGTEQLAAAVPRLDDGADPGWFATALVEAFEADPGRVAAGYELYLLAARQPGLRPAVARWTDLLAELARRQTTDPDAARVWAAAVDGYFLQHLAHGTNPEAAELTRLLGALRAREQ